MARHSRKSPRYQKLHLKTIKPLLRVTITVDGKQVYARTVARTESGIEDTAMMIWHESGAPNSATIEAAELTAEFTVDAEGNWATV